MIKRLLQISALVCLVIVVTTAISLSPKLSNLGPEYATAQAINELEAHLRKNQGAWPTSPDDLKNRFPKDGDVIIDYDIASLELIKNPRELRDAVHPRSKKNLTYPHYQRQIESLLLTLKETNPPPKI